MLFGDGVATARRYGGGAPHSSVVTSGLPRKVLFLVAYIRPFQKQRFVIQCGYGVLAQLIERCIRIAEVTSLNLVHSTNTEIEKHFPWCFFDDLRCENPPLVGAGDE